MTRRILAIGFVFAATSAAWLLLGAVTTARTQTVGSRLAGRVAEVWGPEHWQRAPAVRCDGVPRDLAASDIHVDLALAHRRMGLLWYPTYTVRFRGTYKVANPGADPADCRLTFPFPAPQSIYDQFLTTVDGREVLPQLGREGVALSFTVPPGGESAVGVGYLSRGMRRWQYAFGEGVNRVRDFRLTMTTNFAAIDFPSGSISPAGKERLGRGWRLVWEHRQLISGVQVGMVLPQRLNPGPLASQISFFAPVSLLFFFFVLFVLGVIEGPNLHPMHYFFLAAAFFAFHLLFSYLVDHLDVHLAFVLAAATSVGLVVTYLRAVAGTRFALWRAAPAQLLYLVVFSYAHFFQGLAGLTVSIVAVITLAVVMHATARVDWDSWFRTGQASKPGP